MSHDLLAEAAGGRTRASTGEARTVSVSAILWVAAIAVFAGLRFGALLNLPVAGAELASLSGAWQARSGVGDDRLIPTLFQALSALTLHFTSSEMPARVIALVASLAVPAALWQLRPQLGEAGALLALVVLAFDPTGILFGASATSMAFDLPLALWAAVLIGSPARWARHPAVLVLAGFLVATAGPIALVPAIAALLQLLKRGRAPALSTVLALGSGAMPGLLLATLRFGLGVDGLRIPPVLGFAATYDEPWSTSNGFELAVLYAMPIVVGGLAVHAFRAWRWTRNECPMPFDVFLLAWTGLAAAWWLSSLTSNSPAPLVALTLPLALILGPALVTAANRMSAADWRLARFAIPGAIAVAIIGAAFVLDWAERGRVGGGEEQFRTWAMLALAALILALLALSRRTAATLFSVAIGGGALLLIAGTFSVVAGGAGEPLPSPYSPDQARNLRDVAIGFQEREGGSIVVHPDLWEDAAWPFRDSGEIVLAASPDPDTRIIILPAGSPAPEGFNALAGNWALTRTVDSPADSALDTIHWLFDRSTLAIRPGSVAVYTRASE